jgi:hypothetical protein
VSWVVLPEQEGACLPAGCLAGGPFAQWKSNLTASAFLPSASETDTSSPSRSGTTSEPSTASLGAAPLMSSAEASPARISAPPGEAQALPELARASGLRCSESLARFGLRGSLPKTAQCYALEVWRRYSKGLPASGMMRRGVCWALTTSVRRIAESGCGSLLPTPTGAGNEASPSMSKWPAHRRLAALMLPTPTASSYGSNQGGAAGRVGKIRHNLDKTAQMAGLLPTPIASDRNGDRQRGAGSLERGGGARLTTEMAPGGGTSLCGSG